MVESFARESYLLPLCFGTVKKQQGRRWPENGVSRFSVLKAIVDKGSYESQSAAVICSLKKNCSY